MAEPTAAPDRYLRKWGFAIHARPKDAAPTWRDRLTGKVMAEEAAVMLARARERASQAK